MRRLAELTGRRRWAVLAAWVAVVAVAMPFASKQNERLTSGGFEVSDSQSARAERTLRSEFPQLTGERVGVVLAGGPSATAADYRGAARRVEDALRDERRLAISPAASRAVARGPSEGALLLPLEVRATVRESIDAATDLRHELHLDKDQTGPVRTHLVGRPAQVASVHEVSQHDVEEAERIGFPMVLIILLAVFGSLAAASLPLALAAFSVTITGAVIYLLSTTTDMSVFVVNVASMLGLGVAIDYSLFLLARYREEVRRGTPREEARAIALATSGRTVLFAGVTVIVALASLFLLDNTILRSMAAGAIIVVAVSVLVSVTLLPALIALLGRRLEGRGRVLGAIAARLASLRPRRAEREGEFWERWTMRVMRRPLLAALLSGALLLLLTAPVLDLRIGIDTLRLLPQDHETREGVAIASRIEGPGAGSPAVVTVRFPESVSAAERTRRTGELTRVMARERELGRVRVVAATPDRRTVAIAGVPRSDPEVRASLDSIERVRERMAAAPAADGARVNVGGTSATVVDAVDMIERDLWKVILVVLALSFVVLLALLRSLVLPLKAIVMNLLSVGAATGVLVAVFQWRWLGGVLGAEELGHLQLYVPPLVFAVVFGLSMDYEVFLLTRIRERYRMHGDNRRAVAEGVSSSAKVVSSAALIMVAVFAVFTATSVPVVQQIGLGSAVAVAIDATLVRLVLLPATMTLLGRWNWWLPGTSGALPAPAVTATPRATARRSG